MLMFLNFSFLGYAHVRTVCTKKSASINEDLGGFGGIITATHELAHRYKKFSYIYKDKTSKISFQFSLNISKCFFELCVLF